jgi:GxxExxY protein
MEYCDDDRHYIRPVKKTDSAPAPPPPSPMNEIIRFAEEVYATLKCGFSERVYHNAMEIQLREHGIPYETERNIPVLFKNYVVGFIRADLLVDRSIVVELKSVAKIKQDHIDQCGRYMKLLGYARGIVINFPDTGTSIEVTEVELNAVNTPLIEVSDI